MGGDYYDRDVYTNTTNESSNTNTYSTVSAQVVGKQRGLHPSMDPQKFLTENMKCYNYHPIVFALDVTGSMGSWTRIIYDKMPMFYGQILMQQYLTDPALSFCAIGDAVTDKCPFQVTGFGQGKDIDEMIAKMYLEGAGGGNAHESYELSSYFYNTYVDLVNPELPFFFVTGDEGYWEETNNSIIMAIFGKGLKSGTLNSFECWRELMTKFNVFHIKKAYETFPDKEPLIKAQWRETLGEERVLEIVNPKAIVDVMLGAIAITSGARTLETYIEDMKKRGQTEERIEEVTKALAMYNKKYVNGTIKRVWHKVDKREEKVGEGREENVKKEDLIEIQEIYEKLSLEELSDEQLKYKEELIEMKKILKDKIPKELLCPITGEIFYAPVMTVDGQTYEMKAIELWLEKHDVSPKGGLVLESKMLIPNVVVKQLVSDFYSSVKKQFI